MKNCRSCRANVFAAITRNNKRLVLNCSPDPNGNVYVAADVAEILTGEQLAKAREAGIHLYVCHHVTCRPQPRKE